MAAGVPPVAALLACPSRLLLIVQSTGLGGMETHVIDAAAEFVRRGSEVRVVIPTGAGLDELARRAEAGGATVWRLDTDDRHGRARQVRALVRFASALVRWRPDVVHLHTGAAKGGLPALLAARLSPGTTVVMTEHNVPEGRQGGRQRLRQRTLDRGVHALVAVSRRNARLREEHLRARVRHFAVVLNGVPAPPADHEARARNRRETRERLGVDERDVVVGSLVRLAGDKGLTVLLRAFALLSSYPPARLVLVGDGPLREALGTFAGELDVGDRVIFAGHQADPAPWLDAMDVFVLPVPAGSMSIALLEAMMRGLPPVITFGGPEEAVIPGETGLAPAPNDPAALADALSALVWDASLRRRLGAAAEAHVRRHFSVARVADDLTAVYAVRRTGGLPLRLLTTTPPNPRPADAV